MCCVVLCWVGLCCVVLCSVVLCCVVLSCVGLCCVVLGGCSRILWWILYWCWLKLNLKWMLGVCFESIVHVVVVILLIRCCACIETSLVEIKWKFYYKIYHKTFNKFKKCFNSYISASAKLTECKKLIKKSKICVRSAQRNVVNIVEIYICRSWITIKFKIYMCFMRLII